MVAKDADLNPFWGTGADALSAKARGVEWNAGFEVALGFIGFRVFWVCLCCEWGTQRRGTAWVDFLMPRTHRGLMEIVSFRDHEDLGFC
jgi:hypothetical protein